MASKAAKDKYLERIKGDPLVPRQSHIDDYLRMLDAEEPGARDLLLKDMRATFTSDEGVRVLMLLEKSVLLAAIPNGSGEGALREHNAVRNFVLNLRRLVAHG